jgi:predicted Ser/Thr protein kinase
MVQEHLYRIFSNFAREGRVNKLVLLHGPNGSAKSSLIRCLMAGLEDYSRQGAGALYSFNWIFPKHSLSQERIGFGGSKEIPAAAGDSYAYLVAEDIDARIPCEMHDHPLFLVPNHQRNPLLSKLLPEPDAQEDSDHPRTAISDYLRLGDLCYKCRRIYDALLASYDGDLHRVLNHIQIERFYTSRRYRRAAATIEPQVSVDARIQQVTADRSLAALPKALQHVSLYEPAGPLVDANRGLLEYSDLLKRPVEAFKYLLATVETATVSMDSFVLHLDMAFVASTNETYLDAFKEHPDFPSFKGRIELVKVPYLLRWRTEREIYEPQINPRIVGRHIAPHAVSVASLWGVLTRMRKCDASLYPKQIQSVIEALTPLEKLELYDDGRVPERLTSSDANELLHNLAALYKESLGYPNYEGRFGASARELRTALLNSAHHEEYDCLSPLAVFDEIRDIVSSKSVYEFLRQDVVGKYHDHKAFLAQTEQMFGDWVDNEVRESMGLATEQSYAELFGRYVNHVSHWVKGEKMLDVASGKYIDPDPGLLDEVERVLLSAGEESEDFRRAVISTIGARALENPDTAPDYSQIFRGYIQRLREDFFTQRTSDLRKINEHFLKYTTDGEKGMEPKDVEQAKAMLHFLEQRYGYCVSCARDTVAYVLKTRYAE